MDDMKGKWDVQAANVLMLIYDNAEDGIQSLDAGSLLENGGENGQETTMSSPRTKKTFQASILTMCPT